MEAEVDRIYKLGEPERKTRYKLENGVNQLQGQRGILDDMIK